MFSPNLIHWPYKGRPTCQSPQLMRSLLELVLLSLLLRAGQVQAEERFPFQPQYVEMLAASPVPVRVIDKDQELPEK